MDDFSFTSLPPVPQVERLRRLARLIWKRDEVKALWLGGSLARGQADLYSDVDLRIAVEPDALEAWQTLDLDGLFEGSCAATQLILFGDGRFLRPVVLSSGDLFDLWIQSSTIEPPADATLILACRDAALEARLRRAELPPAPHPALPEPSEIRQEIVNFWVGSLKHRKVLHRGLDLLALTGIEIERGSLVRLWYVAAAGRYIPTQRLTIHTGTPMFHAIDSLIGLKALAILGAPARNRSELLQVIEAHHDEVSRIGRTLAETLGFDYPEALEETVRRAWQEFLAVEELPGTPGS